MSEDLFNIHARLLKKPYREIAWLFTRVIGQDSTTTIPRLAIYILHFTVHEQVIFNWEKNIYGEIYSQLSNFKKNKRFYTSSYLIFVITYCHVFKGLSVGRRVDCKIDPIPMWYQSLWKQKATYHFYEVYNAFVSSFKKLIFGPKTSRLSLEASNLLEKRGPLKVWNTIVLLESIVLMKGFFITRIMFLIK